VPILPAPVPPKRAKNSALTNAGLLIPKARGASALIQVVGANRSRAGYLHGYSNKMLREVSFMFTLPPSYAWSFPLIVSCVVAACSGSNSASHVQAPGTEVSAKTRLLETGAAVLQRKPPIDALNIYLDGFHFYNGTMQAQVEAHHFCSVLNQEVIQCILFDGNTNGAKIMGVEYIISKQLFESLPSEEQSLWHSHMHEVKSGQLIAPGIPGVAEYELMETIVGTYGKTWHTWHTDQHLPLPIGHPLLMMGFTTDGQAHADMIQGRDQRFKVHSEDKRLEREPIPSPSIAPGADAWQQGTILQLSLNPLQHKEGMPPHVETKPSAP